MQIPQLRPIPEYALHAYLFSAASVAAVFFLRVTILDA